MIHEINGTDVVSILLGSGVMITVSEYERDSASVLLTPDQADAIAKDLIECAARARKKAEASNGNA